MNKKAIVKAYKSYSLKEQAKKKFEYLPVTEENVLGILRVLQESFPKKAFSTDEIIYVGHILFWRDQYSECGNVFESGYHWIDKILCRARISGKVVYTKNYEWKLASSAEIKE